MSNVLNFPVVTHKEKIASMDGTDMASVMRYSFGVDVIFTKVTKDEPGAESHYGAEFTPAEAPAGLMVSQDNSKNAVNIWDHCYKGRLFDSRASVIMCFISCLLDDLA